MEVCRASHKFLEKGCIQPDKQVDVQSTMDTAMNVLTKRPFINAARKYPNERHALMDIFRVLQKNDFSSPNQ